MLDESPAHTKRRRFCSSSCANKTQAESPDFGLLPYRFAPSGISKKKWDYDKPGRFYAHRLIMEKKIGRKLQPGETVHHLNGDPRDNREENLALHASHAEHMKACHVAARKRRGR
jgi:hypothetical protein